MSTDNMGVVVSIFAPSAEHQVDSMPRTVKSDIMGRRRGVSG